MRKFFRIIGIIVTSFVSVLVYGDLADAATTLDSDSAYMAPGGSVCFTNAPAAAKTTGRTTVRQYNLAAGQPYQIVKVSVSMSHLAPGTTYQVGLASVFQIGGNGNPNICGIDTVCSFTASVTGRGSCSGLVPGVQIGDAEGRDFQVYVNGGSSLITSKRLLNIAVIN